VAGLRVRSVVMIAAWTVFGNRSAGGGLLVARDGVRSETVEIGDDSGSRKTG
jgi:hypothetical protein